MPNRMTASGVDQGPKSRWRALALSVTLAFGVTTASAGCAAAGPSTDPAAAQVTAASTPAAQAMPSESPLAVDLTSAPATSAAPTSAAARPAAPQTHAPAPAPAPVRTSAKPTQSLCGAPQNPFGYNFCGRGGYIYSPAGGVCDYFDCINNFGNGTGYMVECNDGTYSMSGGKRGVCSYHGGRLRPVYGG
ncbi:hypothetical protein KGA66_25050 [Actinocrinis puniceicyclus]|uniref:Chitin-binding type-2 domain-containing protein n=1 Tax=Actinocrinis puniceicyclus TaxID=977794 RepID=A0A8J8BEF9_9ACTN|nr:hypothetical protein [Actinocrinis puniceicyclus]MBS2966338.1 hypothetical protein [Actinocrinis puniceicyclus]